MCSLSVYGINELTIETDLKPFENQVNFGVGAATLMGSGAIWGSTYAPILGNIVVQ